MNTAEQNYRLLQEIDANRRFMLMAYQQNPKLLEQAEARIRQWFEGQALRQIEERTGFSSPLVPPRNSLGLSPLVVRGRPLRSESSPLLFQRGASLIELIMFIVIVSAALAGILLVMNVTTKGSADPLIRKQAIAAAYSLLEEVELQDFIAASDVTPCTTNGKTTPNPVDQANRAPCYHIVSDYDKFATTGIFSLTGTAAIVGLENYNASVTVVPETAVWNGIAAASAVQIKVTVATSDNRESITATGYRTAY